ncbi:MAG: 50S ribosomal protein L18 [Gemmatimonadales bacterium]
MKLKVRPKTREQRRVRRHLRLRKKVVGTAERPRLVVHRSLKHTYAQLVDDERGATLASASDLQKDYETAGKGKIGQAIGVGKLIAQRATEQGIKHVVFDRGGYSFHGRVKAVAHGARDGGLEF